MMLTGTALHSERWAVVFLGLSWLEGGGEEDIWFYSVS